MSNLTLFMANKSQICNMTAKKVIQTIVEGKDYQIVADEFVSIAKLFEFSDVKVYLTVKSQELRL